MSLNANYDKYFLSGSALLSSLLTGKERKYVLDTVSLPREKYFSIKMNLFEFCHAHGDSSGHIGIPLSEPGVKIIAL
jgi:hypothetical protein